MKRSPRRAPWPLLATCLLLASLLVPGQTARGEGPPAVEVAKGLPVQLDGRVTETEWKPATRIPLDGADGELRVMQFRGTLLLGLSARESWPEGSHFVLWFTAREGDGGTAADGTFSVAFEPFEHDRPHAVVTRMEGRMQASLKEAVVVRAWTQSPGCSAEVAIRMEAMGLTPKSSELKMLMWWGRPDLRRGWVSWPSGLDLKSRNRNVPADMARSTNWGRLKGLVDAGGKGAYSKTAWEEMQKADEHLTVLGGRAHASANELQDERADIPKDDARVQEELFDPLDEIATLEALTSRDHMARAMGLRALNRFEEAATIYETLAKGRDPRMGGQAWYELAMTRREQGFFEREAAAWKALAELPQAKNFAGQYLANERSAKKRASEWQEERKARAEDLKKGLPLLRFETEHGIFYVRLYAHDLPEVTKHVLKIARAGTYDGTRFHRVVGRYVTQGGDPTSKSDCEAAGRGGNDETVSSDPNPRHRFFRGAVGMAQDIGGRLGSQFFICTTAQPKLDQDGYVCIGFVETGMEAVDRLAVCDELIKVQVLTK